MVDDRYKKIPILMLSALVRDRDEEFGLEVGADSYVRKPFRSEQLLEKIRELLGLLRDENPS